MTVLVADDHPPIVDLLTLALEDAGYTVVRAYDGAEARARLERERFDLLIADITMPGLSGMALAAWVRARQPAESALPIVLISASPHPAEAVTPPVTAFVAKPFDLVHVVALVEALVTSPAAN